MKIGAWNIRGVSRPFKQKELRVWIHKNQVALVGVLETRVRAENSSQIISSILPYWQSVTNYSQHPNGRIWLIWDPSIFQVSPLLITDQLIHMEVILMQKQIRFALTFCYGLNCYIQRRNLWQSLCDIALGLDSIPWLAMGDFNVV